MKLCTVHGALARSRVRGIGPWLVESSASTVPLLGVRFGSGGSGTGRAAGSSGVSVYLHGPWVTFGGFGAGGSGAAAATPGAIATRVSVESMTAAAPKASAERERATRILSG